MNENVLLMRRAKAQLQNKWVNIAIGSLIYLLLICLAGYTYIGELILYGPLTLGYVIYIACNIDTGRNDFNLLFKGFERFVDTLVAGLLYSVAVSVGMVLLIVPGIILACGFSMTFFLMLDDRNLSGIDALQKSWNMMKGYKWEYFCLQFRFIGWILLSILTCGIGYIFLYPYMTTANLNFYRKLRYGTY